MTKQIINPPELFDSLQYGFSQIVVTPPGQTLVHMSGQVAWDAQRNIVGKDDLRAQVLQSLANVETSLKHVGGGKEHIAALRIYIKHSHLGEGEAISDGLKQFFGDAPPCATWIGVPALANENFLVEIEPTIVIA